MAARLCIIPSRLKLVKYSRESYYSLDLLQALWFHSASIIVVFYILLSFRPIMLQLEGDSERSLKSRGCGMWPGLHQTEFSLTLSAGVCLWKNANSKWIKICFLLWEWRVYASNILQTYLWVKWELSPEAFLCEKKKLSTFSIKFICPLSISSRCTWQL